MERETPLSTYILLGIISALIVIYSFFSSNDDNVKNSSYCEAIVTDCEENRKMSYLIVSQVNVDYTISYTFEVEGITYGGSERISTSCNIGDKIEIRYNPKNPTENDIP